METPKGGQHVSVQIQPYVPYFDMLPLISLSTSWVILNVTALNAMSDTYKLKNSARRHLRAAEELHTIASAGTQPGCRAVAGYLFGLAGELAVKQMMQEAGIQKLASEHRRQDPYFAHFPQLKTLLNYQLCGRRSGPLAAVVQSDSLFDRWSTEMRYNRTQDINDNDVSSWRTTATHLVQQMGAY